MFNYTVLEWNYHTQRCINLAAAALGVVEREEGLPFKVNPKLSFYFTYTFLEHAGDT